MREKQALNYSNANRLLLKKKQKKHCADQCEACGQSKHIRLDDCFIICHLYALHKSEIVFHTHTHTPPAD